MWTAPEMMQLLGMEPDLVKNAIREFLRHNIKHNGTYADQIQSAQ